MTKTKRMLWEGTPPAQSTESDFHPYLEPHVLSTAEARGAVLICPGGGYTMRAQHEAEPIAKSYNAAGFHAFVVQYRVAPNRHPAPLLDVTRALRMIRSRAGEWHVDPERIAVCGFSAGGHLTGSIGVHYSLPDVDTGDALDVVSCRPNALILCYAVLSAGCRRHVGSFVNLLGPDADPDLVELMSLENQVTEDTPPAFLWHTADDPAVPVANSLLFAGAMAEHGVPFELHVYPQGAHGLGLAPADPHIATWMGLSIDWLRGMGW